MNQEHLKKMIDKAVAYGRKKQSAQTSYLHHYHTEEEIAHTIPVVENFLFVLALFRTSTGDNIAEAKAMLERLLHFQVEGNFPIYLHEYPLCRDRFLAYQLLAPFFWILSHYHAVLGSELKTKTEQAARALIVHIEKVQSEYQVNGMFSLKYACAMKAFGKLWQQQEWQAKGESLLAQPDKSLWGVPAALAEILVSLQMAYITFNGTPWEEFWHYLGNTWHHTTAAYAGPGIKEYQQGFELQPTLYDLYLGYTTGQISARSQTDGIFNVYASLIQPLHDPLPGPLPYSNVSISSVYTLSLADRKEGWSPATDRSFHPLKLLWGDLKRVHSFVCQGGNCRTTTHEWVDGGVDILFELGDVVEGEDREKNREIGFYLDLSEDHKITVGDVSATTFRVNDTLHVVSQKLAFDLTFELLEGNGTFMGHLMKGNRPAQIAIKGTNRYNAYDWQIFLRTVRREKNCRLRAKLRLREV